MDVLPRGYLFDRLPYLEPLTADSLWLDGALLTVRLKHGDIRIVFAGRLDKPPEPEVQRLLQAPGLELELSGVAVGADAVEVAIRLGPDGLLQRFVLHDVRLLEAPRHARYRTRGFTPSPIFDPPLTKRGSR